MYNSILEAIASHAQNYPDQVCIAERNKTCTYAELWKQIVNTASYLQAHGIQDGERVMLYASQTIWYVGTLLGVQLAGTVPVSVDKNTALSRVSEIAEQVEARYLLTPLQMDFPLEQITQNDLESFPWNPSYQVSFPEKDMLSNIVFTTGTTGKSKGVMRTFRNELATAENVVAYASLNENERALVPFPLNHSAALGRVYACLISRALLVPTDGVVFPGVFYSLLDKYKITVIFMAPAHINILLNLDEERLASYNGKLRLITFGTSYLDEATRQRLLKVLPDVKLLITYGCTESSGACSFEFSKYLNRPHCIGKENLNTRILITDENGVEKKDASSGNPGFIAHDGPTVVPGYWNEPELTASVIHNGRLVTRDLGYIDEEGFIYIYGRADDVIISGGNKIAPLEIEDVVMELPEIKECACIPGEDPLLGAVPKLYVVMREDSEFDEGRILRYLEERLERFKVPKAVVQIDEIPKVSGVNKINRRALIEYDRQKG